MASLRKDTSKYSVSICTQSRISSIFPLKSFTNTVNCCIFFSTTDFLKEILRRPISYKSALGLMWTIMILSNRKHKKINIYKPKPPHYLTWCANILIVQARVLLGFKKSGHHYRPQSSGQRPHTCRSRAVLHPYCHDRWCVEGSRASAFVWGSPQSHGGQSNRRCHRRALGEVSSLQVPCHGCRKKKSAPCVRSDY